MCERVSGEEEEEEEAGLAAARKTRIFDFQHPPFFSFFLGGIKPFSLLPSPSLLTAVRCQLSGAEQVAIANINGYYISIQERAQMICLLKHSH